MFVAPQSLAIQFDADFFDYGDHDEGAEVEGLPDEEEDLAGPPPPPPPDGGQAEADAVPVSTRIAVRGAGIDVLFPSFKAQGRITSWCGSISCACKLPKHHKCSRACSPTRWRRLTMFLWSG